MKKLIGNISEKIIVGVISGIILLVLGAIFTPTVILNGVKVFFLWLKDAVVGILAFKISIGWILLGVIFLILILTFLKRIAGKNQPVTFKNAYKTDIIEDVRWVWDWFRDYDGKYDLTNNAPHALCPHCQGELVYTPDSYYRYGYSKLCCEYCGFNKELKGNVEEYKNRIKREIFRRVRTGEWETKIIEKARSN